MATITASDVVSLVRDRRPEVITAANRADLQHAYRSEAVDFANLGDVVWSLPRGVQGESNIVVVRLTDESEPMAILSRAEGDVRGSVSTENGKLFLHEAGGDVYDLGTGGRIDLAGLPALQDAIRHLHGAEARWVESVPVHEKTPTGETVWQGDVHVFELVSHPKVKRAYAWSYATDGTRRKFVAVLGVPPIVDAKTAVQASIAATSKKAQS